MDDTPPDGAPPAPRIVSPAPGGSVAPGADAAVVVTTNAPGLPLELLLLAGDDPGAVVARAEIGADAVFPHTHPLAVPADPRPAQPTSYYLAVGVRAGAAGEQYRHVIPVTTRPAAQ